MIKGLIALDIDGTLVGTDRQVPPSVMRRLIELSDFGWLIAFLTGRTFAFGYQVVQSIPFDYSYSCYNGALTLKMPERQVLRRHLLPLACVPEIETACEQAGTAPFIHLSFEAADACYFRPQALDAATAAYVPVREKQTGEMWKPIDRLDCIPAAEFCYAKAFGLEARMRDIQEGLSDERFASTVISDPLRSGYALILITHPLATKGAALREMRDALGARLPVIGGGDDHNDLTLLLEADIAIAMDTAPPELKKVATIIAPPASEQGILTGLEQALQLVEEWR